MYMDIIGIYLFDQNMGMAFVKARCTHIPLVLIFLGEMQLSVVKSRSALSPLASCYKLGALLFGHSLELGSLFIYSYDIINLFVTYLAKNYFHI